MPPACSVSSAGAHEAQSGSADAKRGANRRVARFAVAFTILRPSMIYGTPRDRNMVRLLQWLERFPVVPSPLGITPQQPVHVDDLVSAILASLERPQAARGEYEVEAEPITLRDVIHDVPLANRAPCQALPIRSRPPTALLCSRGAGSCRFGAAGAGAAADRVEGPSTRGRLARPGFAPELSDGSAPKWR